jgi:acetyltransferase-like isoleucine patch superfamily enzyme
VRAILSDKWTGLRWRASTLLVYLRAWRSAVRIGEGCRFLGQPIWSVADRGSLRIGPRCTLVSDSSGTALGVSRPVILRCLAPGASIEIGADCGLSGVAICAASEIRIGARCLFGADSMIFDTDFHNHEPRGRRYAVPDWAAISKPVTIADDVFIGACAIVQKGVTIGHGAIVAAGSIVVHDVPPMTVVAGNPARVVKRLPGP